MARLVSILSRGQLPFIRPDLFQDPFEGSVPRPLHAMWQTNPHNAVVIPRFRKTLISDSYVSCWHANEAESEAMWRLYCATDAGVALQTTYERLDASLPNFVFWARLGMSITRLESSRRSSMPFPR